MALLERPSNARLITLALFALLVGGWTLYPLLVLRWYDSDVPARAPKAPPGGWPTVDTLSEDYLLDWPERKSDFPAPPLSLRIRPTEWSAWWSLNSKHERRLVPGGPEQVLLEVAVPNSHSVLPEQIKPLCEMSVEPLAGCAGARARLVVSRDAGDWEVLTGKKAPPQRTRITSDGRNVPVIHAFWTRSDRATGREEFLGWACPSGPQDLPLEALSDGQPEALYRCFEPEQWWERRWPDWFGYNQRMLYSRCTGCGMSFLFMGRKVEIDHFELLPARGIEAARFRLMLSAWEMLNRQRQAAAHAPAANAELDEAYAQLATCESVAEEASKYSRERRMRMTEGQRRRLVYLGIACEQAAQIGARMMASPEAEAVLGRALHGIAQLDAFRANAQDLFDAWFAALEAKGSSGKSLEALEASLLYIESGPRYADNDPKREQREARIKLARTLLTQFASELPEHARGEAFQVFASAYQGDEHRLDLAALREEYVALVAQQHGDTSRQVLIPLRDLMMSQWLAGDFEGLPHTVERYRQAWLAQATPQAVADPNGRVEIASAGFHVVFGLRLIAFHDSKHAEMAPRGEEIVGRMRALLGADERWVRAAEFHQREVVTRKAVEGVPIGGGFLPW